VPGQSLAPTAADLPSTPRQRAPRPRPGGAPSGRGTRAALGGSNV